MWQHLLFLRLLREKEEEGIATKPYLIVFIACRSLIYNMLKWVLGQLAFAAAFYEVSKFDEFGLQ